MELHLRLQGGESTEDAVAFLVSRGLSPFESRREVEQIVEASVSADRRKGFVWLGWSAVCALAAAPFLYALSGGMEGARASRGFVQALAQAGALPGLLLLASLVIGLRGLALVFGRRYSGDPD